MGFKPVAIIFDKISNGFSSQSGRFYLNHYLAVLLLIKG